MSAERLHRLTPADLSQQQREVYEAIAGGPRAQGKQVFDLKDGDGALNGPFGLMLHVPGLGSALQELGAAIRYRTSLTARCREIAILEVAAAEDSDFERYAHERVAESIGMSAEEIRTLRSREFTSDDSREQAVADLSRHVIDGVEVSDEQFAQWASALGHEQMLETIVLVGYYRTLAAMMRIFAVAAPSD